MLNNNIIVTAKDDSINTYIMQQNNSTNEAILLDTTSDVQKEKHYDDLTYQFENLAINMINQVEEKYKNEYCIVFGTRVLHHYKSKAEAHTKYIEISKMLHVGFYMPL